MQRKVVSIVGAGLVGSVLATLLSDRGHRVNLFEKRNVLDAKELSNQRSTHLVVSHRGWRALEAAGVEKAVLRESIPLYGRCVHGRDGSESFHPYVDGNKCIYAIHRADLNKILFQKSISSENVSTYTNHELVDLAVQEGTLTLFDKAEARQVTFNQDYIFAADGAFSTCREILSRKGFVQVQQSFESYGYKEVSIPEGVSKGFRRDAMHAWPRGDVSFYAFPNNDGSFTGTIIAPVSGKYGLDKMISKRAAFEILREWVPELAIDDIAESAGKGKLSRLVTVSCNPWVVGKSIVVVGDAAHAMVPFLGQGMNCALEDCLKLLELIDANSNVKEFPLRQFQSARKPDADAISLMSSDMITELTMELDREDYYVRKGIERMLRTAFPDKYKAAYEMIAFTDTPYSQVLGEVRRLELITRSLSRETEVLRLLEGTYPVRKIRQVICSHVRSKCNETVAGQF